MVSGKKHLFVSYRSMDAHSWKYLEIEAFIYMEIQWT